MSNNRPSDVARDTFFKRNRGTHQNGLHNRGANLKKNERFNRRDDRETSPRRTEGKSKNFDKKTYRLKKYSNKYKLEKWEDNRRKSVLKKYYKDLKNDPVYGNYKPFDYDRVEDDDSSDEEGKSPEEIRREIEGTAKKTGDDVTADDDEKLNYVMHPSLMETMKRKEKQKNQPFWKAKQEFDRLKNEKNVQREAALKAKEERTQALEKYKVKKSEKFKKLSKKTKKGQPLMKDRMQMLLENIQSSL